MDGADTTQDESEWPMGRGNLARTGAVGTGPQREPSSLWSYEMDDKTGEIAVTDEMVYCGDSGGVVTALTADTGTLTWTFETDGAVTAAPAVTDGVVYVLSQDEHVYALDAETGEKLWEFEARGSFARFRKSPAVADGVVYAPCNDSTFYALDAETGEELWAHEGAGDFGASPIVANGLVYARCGNDKLYALTAQDGIKRWERDLGSPYGGGETAPALSEDTIYIGNDGGNSFQAFEAETGRKVWEAELDGTPVDTPVAVDGTVYVCCEDEMLRALNADDGDLVWEASVDGAKGNSPAVAGGVVYTTAGNYLEAFDATSGARQFSLQRYRSTPSPVVADGAVITGGDGLEVYGLTGGADDSEEANDTTEDPDEGAETGAESTGSGGGAFEKHYVRTATDDADDPSDDQIREAILGILCDKWQTLNRDARLSLEFVTEAVLEVLPGATSGLVKHNVQRLDNQNAVDFDPAFDTVSLRPMGAVQYDERSHETVMPEDQYIEVLEMLYSRARHDPDAPHMSRDELLDQTGFDPEVLDRTVWFLRSTGLQIGDIHIDDDDVGGYIDVDEVGDSPWWHTASINRFGQQLYENVSR